MKRIVICGAAGRDFHNFNVVHRDDPAIRVVAFTATQIPGIDARRYPAELAGARYPDGIPIFPEHELDALCRRERVDTVVFAYSDVTHEHVMHLASRVLAAGCDFTILVPARLCCCAQAGDCGVGGAHRLRQVADGAPSRRPAEGARPARRGGAASDAVRQSGPAARAGLPLVRRSRRARCTVEEREEYEPHIEAGHAVFAGVDYADVLAAAERACDVIVWDGGNNDFLLRADRARGGV